MKKVQEKNSYKLFKFGSLLALFLMACLYSLYIYKQIGQQSQPSASKPDASKPDARYFLKDYKENRDPMLTKVPNLKDLLAGPIISQNDPVIGELDAKVVLVQFSDFECQYCQQQEEVLKRIIANYQTETALIWKDYPENDVESDSYQAAIAARCAQEQGKFWEFHDLIYKNKKFDAETFAQIAQSTSLNVDKFKTCIKNKETANLINDNIKEAHTLDISGIPFLYINSQEVMGEINYEDLERIVEIELQKNE